jgi:hypothetical protein
MDDDNHYLIPAAEVERIEEERFSRLAEVAPGLIAKPQPVPER